MRGFGTQQLERLLAERFPERALARMDLDTTSTKWSHQRILAAVEAGEVDLLLGTQMIAKGLDFPNVTLVGVVNADTGLYLPDFRSAERTFQLLAQVAGRAGRGPKGGRVLVQTRHPAHHALVWAAQHDAEGFLREERALRESPPYPPTTSLVNLLSSPGPDEPPWAGAPRSWPTGARRWSTKYRLPVTLLGPGAVPARADQGPLALARAAQGAIGGARPHRALRGDAADAGGRRAGRDRSGSGVVALTAKPANARPHRPRPDTRSPLRSRSIRIGAGSNTRPPAPFSVTDPTYRRFHRLFTPRKGPSWRLPTSPSQPSRRLVTPAPQESDDESVLGSSAASDELSVWSASRKKPAGSAVRSPSRQ